jgi:GT2 family glycosyltransferase
MSQIKEYRVKMIGELMLANTPSTMMKDIFIVVHDQLEYVKKCLSSIEEHTENYRIYVWDNDSQEETRDYLLDQGKKIYRYYRSNSNHGFIKPNNSMVKDGKSEFIILLNSDCEVKKGWDLAMVNHLVENPSCGQVGYSGRIVDAGGFGYGPRHYGTTAHFIAGWCFAMRRSLYDQIGLFDEENLEFAYGEDSDLSFKVRENGLGIYALHLDLAIHHENKTINSVRNELGNYVKYTFDRNHEYIRNKWKHLLPSKIDQTMQ